VGRIKQLSRCPECGVMVDTDHCYGCELSAEATARKVIDSNRHLGLAELHAAIREQVARKFDYVRLSYIRINELIGK